jgi:hypothetical protein
MDEDDTEFLIGQMAATIYAMLLQTRPNSGVPDNRVRLRHEAIDEACALLRSVRQTNIRTILSS